jgi:hypothetical protein
MAVTKNQQDQVMACSSEENVGQLEKGQVAENDFEVFKKGEGMVDFRTVAWPHAAMIFLKSMLLHCHVRTPSNKQQSSLPQVSCQFHLPCTVWEHFLVL